MAVGSGFSPTQKPARTRKPGYRRIIDYPRYGRHGWRALVPSWRLTAGLGAASALSLIGLVLVVYALVKTPDLNDLRLPTATVYEYSDGTPFYTAGQDRVIIPAGQIPPVVAHAVVAVENPTFYTDTGISPRGTLRALVNDVRGNPVQGGSTITQQFVKNAYLTDRQTLSRKLAEIFVAAKITRAYSKSQILDDYFNTVYFGRASYGIEAAAETYFGIHARQMTSPAQAAYLAALVNAPTVLSQTDAADQALLRQRWNLVLNDMVKVGYLTARQRAAVHWPAVLPPSGTTRYDQNGVNESAMAQVADDYLDQVHAANPAVPDAATAEAGGEVIVTTFTRVAMTAAVRAVREQLYDRLKPQDKTQAAVDAGVQVGLATVDTGTGELLGFYPGSSDFDNATQAQVEPGSQMEFFAALAPFAAGKRPTSGPLWNLMSRTGLTRNLTSDPAELPEPLGKLKDDPDLDLGIAPESPARIADAYTIAVDGGVYRDLSMIRSVTVGGRPEWTLSLAGTALLPSSLARIVALNALLAPSQPAGPRAMPASLSSFSGAGIPGTIGGDHTAWFTGFGDDTVTSVALWDQSVSGGRIVQHSLAGLGAVPATSTVTWPTAIWKSDTSMLSVPGAG